MTTIVLAGDIRTMDARHEGAGAVAFRDGVILAVGSLDALRTQFADAEVRDAGERAILPGFVDLHHHVSLAALWGGLTRLSPPGVTDIASLQRTLREAAKSHPPGEWLVATEWDELRLAERRAPTRRELDDAVPDHPLLAMHYSCHRAAANSRALELAGITRATGEPSGGAIERDSRGDPSGLLIERGMSRVETLARAGLVARDADGFFARLSRHHAAMVAVGITRVCDTAVPSDVATLYREAVRRGELIVPTVMLPVSTTGYLETPWDALEGPATGEGDDLLSVGPLKLVLDGAPVCALCLSWWQTAGVFVRSIAVAVRHRSLDPIRTTMSSSPRIGAKLHTGITIYRPDEGRAIAQTAIERGFGIAAHAIGNEAIELALSIYEAIGSRIDAAGTPRIEHATFASRDLVARIAGCGAAVVAQPAFLSLPAFASAPSLPGLPNTPLRWLIEAGITVGGSSDYPVAGFDPLDGIRSAVLRRTARGETFEPDQRATLDEAIAMYTRNAGVILGNGHGTIAPGNRADLVVLDGPLRTEADLENRRVASTIVAGKTVYAA